MKQFFFSSRENQNSVYKTLFYRFLLTTAGIAKPSCCKEFKASVEKKNLAYQLLCPVLSTAPFSWCRDIKVQLVDKLLIAYQTVCPNDPIPTIKIGASKFLIIYIILHST